MIKSFSRICFAGEDLDWTGGSSLLCNINLWTTVSIEKNNENYIYIESNITGKKCIERDCVKLKIGYSLDEFDYIIGAINIFEKYYHKIGYIKILVNSLIPPKSGLSSSAALLTSFFSEIFTFYNIAYDKNVICELCYETEYNELKSQVGKMDFVSCMSNGLLLYDSSKNEEELLVNPFNDMDLLLINCGHMSSTREVNRNKYNRYIKHEKSFMQYLEKGNNLVKEIYQKIICGDDARDIAELINEYQFIMRVYLKACTKEINEVVEKSMDMGALCAKLTGCGGGGFVFSIFEKDTSHEYQRYLIEEGISYIRGKMF